MTTNSEHRRRETDRVDQISLKYQLEKAEERIAELGMLLNKYGRHKSNCAATFPGFPQMKCDCGYAETISKDINNPPPKLNQDE